MWAGVTERFKTFHQNLRLTTDQIEEGVTHHEGVRRCLNRHYYSSSDTANSLLIGSWGKETRARPPRDIDIYFVLPPAVFYRYQLVQGNKQSALLQEVKRIVQGGYPNTDLRGDGQVVVVRFNRLSVEVVPAFLLDNGQYAICDTHYGGRYITTDPHAELRHIDVVDVLCSNNLRPLVMMLKAWQEYCNVPIKSFSLELVAADFLTQCQWRNNSYYYYDWIVRDFFVYLYSKANTVVYVPGTFEAINLGDDWLSRVVSAYGRAAKACDHEYIDCVILAGEEWQKIFGNQIPKTV